MKVAINGAGRIGRACARLILDRDDLELVAINDLMDADQTRYLIRYDSIYGKSQKSLETIEFLSGKREALTGADVLLECSGQFLTSDQNRDILKNSLKRVIISAMPLDNTPVAKPAVYQKGEIISAGSCTTNALYLITNAINKLGVEALLATSIHSYTSDQRLLDKHHSEKRRSRQVAGNIIPVISNAAKNLAHFGMDTPASAIGLRVPTPNVSILQATFKLKTAQTKDIINRSLAEFASSALVVTDEPFVSSDIVGSRASAVVDTTLTMVSGTLVSIFAWHDNELGYAARVVDQIKEQNELQND